MPGIYGDHGDGGWWQGDIVASLTPDPYDPMGGHGGFSVGASAAGGSGSPPSGGSGEAEGEDEKLNETNFPYDTYLTQMD